MHNYSTGMAIVMALQGSSVHRLARTWKGLGKKENNAWDTMSSLFSNENNFSTYRRALQQAHGEPCIPYIGLLLQDLLMIEEIPTFLPSSSTENKIVNFRKMRRFALVQREDIQARQSAADRYQFELLPSFREYLIHAPILHDADLYRCSRECEPAMLA